ncbi:XRE family transcriptional regulator [Streptomyces sp. WMMC500]|uniref:XRE family transcriptional regulator n=1 Tax=Streptomyces sp. WMMC500 TaxID=3015154 RepID=UPI00248B12DA|nr:XRE family transcriptional regulator [Streptomyces sp. WMMC500]WBB58666.1 XRE family transcriptional regulator [Streptomyces sp. WMMC500]
MSDRDGGLPGSSQSPAPQPAELRTRAEYVAALRALRTWSGLTYRELEAKATTHADSLPASTIATTLGRATLPRERFVDAFTRACGLAEQDVAAWLEARRRIATHEHAAPAAEPAPAAPQPRSHPQPAPSPGPHPAPSGNGDRAAPPPATASRWRWRWRWAAGLLAAAGIGAGGTLGVQALLPDDAEPDPPRTTIGGDPVPGLDIKAVGSWAQIHPARTPSLCVTEGTDRSGRYRSAVAAQQPCAQSVQPRVYLEPVGDGAVQIQWHHPKHGIGCLTAMREGRGRGLVEPREACADDDPAQRFHVEAGGRRGATHFRIRLGTGECLGLRDEETAAGAEIVQAPCSDAADREFRISLTPPPP